MLRYSCPDNNIMFLKKIFVLENASFRVVDP